MEGKEARHLLSPLALSEFPLTNQSYTSLSKVESEIPVRITPSQNTVFGAGSFLLDGSDEVWITLRSS